MSQKSDEVEFWNAVCIAKADDLGLVYAGPIAERLGISVKRAEYLCDKWMKQGKWTRYGSMTGILKYNSAGDKRTIDSV